MSTKSTRTATRPARSAAKPASRATAKLRTATKSSHRPAPVATQSQGSKQSQLIALLRTPAGATIHQLTQLTGWQPHSVRGVISGALRKRLKLNVTCVEHVYRIEAGQA